MKGWTSAIGLDGMTKIDDLKGAARRDATHPLRWTIVSCLTFMFLIQPQIVLRYVAIYE